MHSAPAPSLEVPIQDLEICPFTSAPQFWCRKFQEQGLWNNQGTVSLVTLEWQRTTLKAKVLGQEKTLRGLDSSPWMSWMMLPSCCCPYRSGPWKGAGHWSTWERWELWKILTTCWQGKKPEKNTKYMKSFMPISTRTYCTQLVIRETLFSPTASASPLRRSQSPLTLWGIHGAAGLP